MSERLTNLEVADAVLDALEKLGEFAEDWSGDYAYVNWSRVPEHVRDLLDDGERDEISECAEIMDADGGATGAEPKGASSEARVRLEALFRDLRARGAL